MNPVVRAVHVVDGVQRRVGPLALLIGVIKKFGDDRGGSLAALLAYYGFLSLFPLLLLLVTVVGMVSGGNPAAIHRVEHSALSQFPIVGQQLGANIHQLHQRGGVGVAIGIAGLLWGSQGTIQAGQYAMAEVWNVPNVERPGYLARLFRTLGMMGLLGVSLVASMGLAGVATIGNRAATDVAAAVVLSLVLNAGIYALAFRLLTPKQIDWRSLLPGAVAGGVGWTVLQYVGGALVDHTLRNTSQIYGFFAVVLGLLAWIYLGAQLTLYAAEVNVVRARHLWPRSLLQPPLTDADKRVLADITIQSKSRPEQEVRVGFDHSERTITGQDADPHAQPSSGAEDEASTPTSDRRTQVSAHP